MIINFLKPHALNLGEDFEYISTFVKGRTKVTTDKYRILVRGVNTGKEYLLALEGRPSFFGRPLSYHINTIEVTNYVTPTYIKGENKKYNYYFHTNDTAPVHEFFDTWVKSDPMVQIGGLKHNFLSAIPNYKGTYKFDNITY